MITQPLFLLLCSKQVFEIRGSIDDIADFGPISRASDQQVTLDLDGVSGANSFGIRIWSKFIQTIKDRKIRYLRCRPTLITQFNVVQSLIKGVDLVSFYAPFECSGCQIEQEMLITMEAAQKADFVSTINDQFNCTRCNRHLSLVEDADNYFQFLEQKAA